VNTLKSNASELAEPAKTTPLEIMLSFLKALGTSVVDESTGEITTMVSWQKIRFGNMFPQFAGYHSSSVLNGNLFS